MTVSYRGCAPGAKALYRLSRPSPAAAANWVMLRARATVPRAAASFTRIVAAISRFAKGDQP